jgi:hypothetical protein
VGPAERGTQLPVGNGQEKNRHGDARIANKDKER